MPLQKPTIVAGFVTRIRQASLARGRTAGVRRAASLMLLIVGAAACGAATSHASVNPRVRSTPPQRAEPAACARTRRPEHVAPNAWTPARRRLAPGRPDAIRLCRYSRLADHRRVRLVRSRLLSDPTLLTQLVVEFNELPPFPPGAFACPADDGSQIVALLAYSNGRQVTIAAELTGCQGVTNGDVVRIANGYGDHPRLGPRLLTELKRLTR